MTFINILLQSPAKQVKSVDAAHIFKQQDMAAAISKE